MIGTLLGFTLSLPSRSAHAPTGTEIAAAVERLSPRDREARYEREILAGNLPTWLRRFVEVPVERKIDGRTVHATLFVAPDYLMAGSDSDRLTLNLTPFTAQRIADRIGCVLPTPAMVDAIDAAATIRLEPRPIPPSPAMTTVPVFRYHNAMVAAQRDAVGRWGELVCGGQKDVVVCTGLAKNPTKVAIYGWRKPDGNPIQPLYLGHFATWVDYSHGIRLVAKTMEVDGRRMDVAQVLADPKMAVLVSGEGPVANPRYGFTEFPRDGSEPLDLPAGESVETFSPAKGVTAMIDWPEPRPGHPRLVIYALPNGNTIEQTFGRRMKPGLDWHVDIQHIGAQTRFLRRLPGYESLVVAYVANDQRAWPAWLRGKDPKAAVEIVDGIAKRVGAERLTLNSHSGGGALLFAYLRVIDRIPDQVERLAFLDSEYNYDATAHLPKLIDWLDRGGRLVGLAYDDANALLDGKPFVSKEGGTWGRTHALLRDLEGRYHFTAHLLDDPERYDALDGRVTLWFKRNPERAIYHTVQVERNGFIESILAGTPLAGRGYRYFGDRAYAGFIRD